MKLLPNDANQWKTYGDMHTDLRLRGFGKLQSRAIDVNYRNLEDARITCSGIMGAMIGLGIFLGAVAIVHYFKSLNVQNLTIAGIAGGVPIGMSLLGVPLLKVIALKKRQHLETEIPKEEAESMLAKLKQQNITQVNELSNVCQSEGGNE